MKKEVRVDLRLGRPLPLGVSYDNDGVNFAVFSRHATAVTLLLFESIHDQLPISKIELASNTNKTGDIWHIGLQLSNATVFYLWQVDGEFSPRTGHRFNSYSALIDPYATSLVGTACWDYRYCCDLPVPGSTTRLDCHDTAYKPKCLSQVGTFDWQGDQHPKHAWSDTIIYETHVRGFTIHNSSNTTFSGTFLGVVEKIPYLKSLGITAIEFLPIQEFHENELPRKNPLTGSPLKNYWGYSTVAFFAPKESYSSRQDHGIAITEFKTMVRELHKADIEVILDIVFNHTSEGNHLGPTLNFRGLDNSIYYILEDDKSFYKNYSGTGNTLNCNHPVVRDYILDCLRYWVIEMHVDGFRFDLASILGRNEHGDLLPNPPLLERIAEDPVLRGIKLIAEAWDAGGAYQLGHFQGARWSEWNGRFRDDVRRFWRGDHGLNGALAHRFCGSADVYQSHNKQPVHSINFVTCHDGFTLNDLVSYKQKHNTENGENNADGSNDNNSLNYGIEGPTDDSQIESLRVRHIKNVLATLLLSRGVPMLLGGDEIRRSQCGNNNAYCQDNDISWIDWSLAEKNKEILNFTRDLISIRKHYSVFRAQQFYSSDTIYWFGPSDNPPNWNRGEGILGCLINSQKSIERRVIVMFNASERSISFSFPKNTHAHQWKIIVDTSSCYADTFGCKSVVSRRFYGASGYQLSGRSLVVCVESF